MDQYGLGNEIDAQYQIEFERLEADFKKNNNNNGNNDIGFALLDNSD